MPLILSHGWPGSIVEFHKVIEPLTDPTRFGGDAADAFHVVAPSLPGYGFSGKPTETGWGVEKIGEVFADIDEPARLRPLRRAGRRLGIGDHTLDRRARSRALRSDPHDACDGCAVRRISRTSHPTKLDAIERAGYYSDWDSGYSKQQSTRPQSVGYGLVDSPSAQAAWIIEKFWAWTDNADESGTEASRHPENVLARDELLDNIMLYWINGNGASSARLYWESFRKRRPSGGRRPPRPGSRRFPKEIVPPIRKWVEPRYPGLCHWAEYDKGRPLRCLRSARRLRRRSPHVLPHLPLTHADGAIHRLLLPRPDPTVRRCGRDRSDRIPRSDRTVFQFTSDPLRSHGYRRARPLQFSRT